MDGAQVQVASAKPTLRAREYTRCWAVVMIRRRAEIYWTDYLLALGALYYQQATCCTPGSMCVNRVQKPIYKKLAYHCAKVALGFALLSRSVIGG